MAIQLLFCRALLPGFVQNSTLHSYVIPIYLFPPRVTLESRSCTHTIVQTQPLLGGYRFILSERSDFHIIDCLSIAFYAFAWPMLTSLAVDEKLLPRYVNWSTNFRGLPLKVGMASFCLKYRNVFLVFMWRLLPYTACSSQCSRCICGKR